MHPTRIQLSIEQRHQICTLLQQLLVESTDLALALKVAHWNVRGPQFLPLHELFDQLADKLRGHGDDLAERIAQLGGQPDATAKRVAEQSELEAYPVTATTAEDHLTAVADRWADFANACRRAIETADDADDEVTTDLLTGLTGDLDKQLWFLEAHLVGA